MPTRTGRQALLCNRCRNIADNGRPERAPPTPAVGNSPSLIFSETFSLNVGGDETNKSFSLCLTTISFPLSDDFPSPRGRLPGDPTSRSGGSLLPPRLSSIRRVLLLRRRWVTGLVVGLLVGLPATGHCVANSLNFCRVVMICSCK